MEARKDVELQFVSALKVGRCLLMTKGGGIGDDVGDFVITNEGTYEAVLSIVPELSQGDLVISLDAETTDDFGKVFSRGSAKPIGIAKQQKPGVFHLEIDREACPNGQLVLEKRIR
jgi:hypothetical protein